MARATYRARGIVLKRTKLGESDCICTLLDEQGAQIRAVAKGARKPTSPFTSRLELFSVCDLLLVEGKSLDIIKEVRLIEANVALRCDLDLMQAASPMVELLDRATLSSLENKNLYPLTVKALHLLSEVESGQVLLFCAAHLIKTLSFLGFKPELSLCVGCGNDQVIARCLDEGRSCTFSYLEGGLICDTCRSHCETVYLDPQVIQWAKALLYSTFETIETFHVDSQIQLSILRFLQSWIKHYVGSNLKSLTYLFTYGFLGEDKPSAIDAPGEA